MCICALFGSFISCNSKKSENNPEVISVTADDQDMNKAIEKAKANFDQFKTAFTDSDKYSEFYIKQEFIQKDGNIEHMWIGDLEYDGKQFKGILQNEPINESDLKAGDKIKVDPDKISDWTYIEEKTGNTHGGYTIKVLYNMMTNEEKASFDNGQNGKYVDW